MDGENHWQNTFPCISPFISFKNTLYHIFIMVLNQCFVLILFLNLRLQQIRTVGISETFNKKKTSSKNWKPISCQSDGFGFCLLLFFFFFLNQGRLLLQVCKFYIPVWLIGWIANSNKLLNCIEMRFHVCSYDHSFGPACFLLYGPVDEQRSLVLRRPHSVH